jgi:uncharacterized protein (DUF983 family)
MKINLGAIVLQRCPRCGKGPIFHGFISTNKRCPKCGLTFERDAGYFTGAMYASYGLGMLTSLPVWLTLLLLEYNPVIIMGEAILQIVVTMPILFRYSRTIWLHLDNAVNPFPPQTAEEREAVAQGS